MASAGLAASKKEVTLVGISTGRYDVISAGEEFFLTSYPEGEKKVNRIL